MVENITIDLYRINLNILIGETIQEAIDQSSNLSEYYKKRNEDFTHAHGLYVSEPELNVFAIVLTRNTKISTITHECFHATYDLLRNKGMALCDESEEAYAYFHGYICEKVFELHKKYCKKKK